MRIFAVKFAPKCRNLIIHAGQRRDHRPKTPPAAVDSMQPGAFEKSHRFLRPRRRRDVPIMRHAPQQKIPHAPADHIRLKARIGKKAQQRQCPGIPSRRRKPLPLRFPKCKHALSPLPRFSFYILLLYRFENQLSRNFSVDRKRAESLERRARIWASGAR